MDIISDFRNKTSNTADVKHIIMHINAKNVIYHTS